MSRFNYGTIAAKTARDQFDFEDAVREAYNDAARQFNGNPADVDWNTDINFVACSTAGDVYMVHFTRGDETCSVKITQEGVTQDGTYRSIKLSG